MSQYNHYDLVRKPIITEKSTMLSELGKYTFEVAVSADKTSIKKAVEAIFDVKVEKVNVLNVQGKSKRFRGTIGKRSDWKKAVVTLAKGSTIDFTGMVK